MRNNTRFDEKVRQYVANHHIQHFRNIDELTGMRCNNTVIHELFSGNDTRKRCFYVKDCIYFLSTQSHEQVHRNNLDILLIMNRTGKSKTEAIEYYEKLRLLVNTFDIKKARYEWKEFFKNNTESPLLEVE